MAQTLNPDYIRELTCWVNESPFPQHMKMRLLSVEYDKAELELDIDPSHFQVFGLVHGGVMATLIDTATFWSVYLRLPEDAGLVNVDLRLNYLKSVTEGPLIARGNCIKSGRTLSYAQAAVYNVHGDMFAHGTSTLMALPGKNVCLKHPKFVDSP